ncbi:MULTISPECIES: quinone oxidoreductase [unclassified Rhizobium]|uniref:quinone oxidoreductase family protein n=1 Tax=unclassified Rhizobium TaxID=2613769 RepID=UPI000EAA628F|nr:MULTISPECIES: quinone oxidoreductase [unclassified Rhizobium]AYG70069.1 quinone oxidoreductase [Rhizobium sp. CCGE531]AYG76444.1 quinone oxidoreductase [Rhizobium sp. CCGE532]
MSVKSLAARIHSYGPPEVLTFEDVFLPEPGEGEALVRHTVIGLNFVDVYFRRGSMDVASFPAVIGNEAAGIVEAIGPAVTHVKVGDRVVFGHSTGAYATLGIHPADRLVVIPDGVSDTQAAASFLKGLTARYLVKDVVPLKPGDTILYHAAAGGVGQIFVQWAKSLGYHVIGTVSGESKIKVALKAGCDHVINYSTEDFVARTFELTGGVGVEAVFDSVGEDTFRGSLAVLKVRGTLVQFGKASGEITPIDPYLLGPRGLHLTWPMLQHYVSTPEQTAEAAADLFARIKTGHLKVDPTHIYAFEDVVAAHRDLEGRHTMGSAVLRVKN